MQRLAVSSIGTLQVCLPLQAQIEARWIETEIAGMGLGSWRFGQRARYGLGTGNRRRKPSRVMRKWITNQPLLSF